MSRHVNKIIGVALLSLAFVGCSNNGTQDGTSQTTSASPSPGKSSNPVPTNQVKADPVTITANVFGVLIDDFFEGLLIGEVKKRYPHITLQIERPTTSIDQVIASGKIPDILIGFNGQLTNYQEKELLMDLTALIKAQQIDLGSIEANYIQDIQRMTPGSTGLYALPYGANFHTMYYNKDIFNRFAVPTPTDGMTWEQLVELAKKVTRLDNGIQYRGLDTGLGLTWMSQPLSLVNIDPVAIKPAINQPSWKRVFELYKSIVTIPGNAPTTGKAPKDEFLKDKTLAVLLQLNIFADIEKVVGDGFNWDIAQYPSYPEKPNTYGNSSVHMMLVTSTSKNKEDAMKVIGTVISEPVQQQISQRGHVTSLKSTSVKQAFGKDIPVLQGKNVAGIFKSKPVDYPLNSSISIGDSVSKPLEEYLNGTIDVNTLISRAEEAINQKIVAAKGK